jgi:NADPH2:quinone reductase
MKALRIEGIGQDPKLVEVDSPQVGDEQVLIQVAVCGVNFPDLLIQQGKYQFLPEYPYTPGGEFSGLVLKVGAGVTRFHVGQRVYGLERWGAMGERIVLDESRVFPLPDSMGLKEAAAMMYTYSTVLHALKDRAKCMSGERLLVLGASGGIGRAAVETGKAYGLVVFGVSGSEEGKERVLRHGAQGVFDYSNFKEGIKTSVGAVDIVLDPVGGAYAESALRCLSPGGRYLVLGFAGGSVPALPLNLVLLKSASVLGVFWGKFSRDFPQKQVENAEEIFALHAKNVIGMGDIEEFHWENAQEILTHFAMKKGKRVLICNPTLLKRDQTVRPKYIPQKRQFLTIEEVYHAVGEELGTSAPLQITQQMVDDFAHSTQDQQWIHVNPVKAASSPFGATIVHGFLTLSLSPRFLNEIYEMPFVRMGINFGVDKVRFLAPIKVNALVSMKASLLQAEPSRNGGLKMRIGATYFVEGQAVCTAELLSVVYAGASR